MLVAAALAAAVAAGPAGARAQEGWPAFGLQPGPGAVGTKSQLVFDGARPLPSGDMRPVQVTLWYPAADAYGARMTYGSYFALAAEELRSALTADSAARAEQSYRAFLASRGVPEATMAAWLGAPMRAFRDAEPAKGRFPIVLLAPGNDASAHDHAVLAELLASRGYIVAAAPSPMRITGAMQSEGEVGARARDQMQDLSLALDAAVRLGGDRDRVGVVGHSFGARGALLLAMADPRVRALVSLDGGIGTAAARAAYESVPAFRAPEMKTPLLHVYEELDAYMAPDFATLRSLANAERWLARATDLHHHHFTSLGAASAAWPELGKATGATAGTGRAWAAVAGSTVEFLDAFVKGDGKARKRVESTGWPAGMKVERLRAVK